MQQRILVADTDPAALQTIEEAAACFGAECLSAVNEDEAFRRFLESGPEVVFVDALVPRKGAFELLKRIRGTEEGARTAVFVTSGFRGGTDLREQAVKTWGALGVLPKPLNIEAVRAELGKLLRSPETKAPESHWLLWGKVEEEGGFDRASFPLVFTHAFRREDACRLAISNGKVRKVLHFSEGKLTFAHSNLFSETLARHLLDRGVVTEEGYKKAIRMTIETGMKVGEAFVALSQTDAATVDAAVRRNILNKVLDVFTWSEGWYKIIPYAAPVADIPEGPIPGESLLWTVVHEQMSPVTIRSALEDAKDRNLRIGREGDALPGESVVGDMAPLLRSLQLSVPGKKIGSALKGSAWEHPSALLYLILLGFFKPEEGNEASLPADPALRKLYREAQGKLSWMRGRNAFQILGVGVDADDGEVFEAFRRLSARFGPAAEPPNAPDSLIRLLRAAFQLIRHAFEELSTAEARKNYLAEIKGETGGYSVALRAEASFREGVEALRLRNWDAAYRAFKTAAETNPVESEYALYVGIARMHQSTPDVETALSEAEQELWKAHAAAPHNAEPLYQLGNVAVRRGDYERAKDLFERALRCNPNHERTKNKLERLQRRAGKGLGNKIGSFFSGR